MNNKTIQSYNEKIERLKEIITSGPITPLAIFIGGSVAVSQPVIWETLQAKYFLSDIDMYIIYPDDTHIPHQLTSRIHEECNEVKVDVSLYTLRKFKTTFSPNLTNKILVTYGKTILGPREILSELQKSIEELDYWREGIRLLINRMGEIISNRARSSQPQRQIYLCHKSILDLVMTLLALKTNTISFPYKDRIDIFKNRVNTLKFCLISSAKLLALAKTSLDFLLSPPPEQKLQKGEIEKIENLSLWWLSHGLMEHLLHKQIFTFDYAFSLVRCFLRPKCFIKGKEWHYFLKELTNKTTVKKRNVIINFLKLLGSPTAITYTLVALESAKSGHHFSPIPYYHPMIGEIVTKLFLPINKYESAFLVPLCWEVTVG